MIDKNSPICDGYLRANGLKGIRNKLLIIYTVDCSAYVAYRISDALRQKGIDNEVIGQRSCFDHQNKIRALLAYCVHPNIGGVLVVANGCEATNGKSIKEFSENNGRPSEWFYLLDSGGTVKGIEKGVLLGEKIYSEMENEKKIVPFFLGDLIISGKCGGSDATSGMAANPLVGSAFDRVIDAGGSCMFAEINEGLGLKDFFVSRCVDEKAVEEVSATYDKAELSGRMARRYFIGVGNVAGGLTTIEEKSMGASAKSGTKPIQGVLKIAQQPPWPGLWVFDETTDEIPPRRFPNECNQGGDCAVLMAMGTAGAHISYLTTGCGHVCGIGISPTIKITGNPRTFNMLIDDIDINASKVLTGEKTMEEMTDELLQYTINICKGAPTHADRHGHKENEMWSIAQDDVACRKFCE